MYWPRALTYGNWGGPGWSGGEFVHDRDRVDWTVPPVDEMDALFKIHDFEVQNKIQGAHAGLYHGLLNMVMKPKGTWSRFYRYAAIAVFWGLK